MLLTLLDEAVIWYLGTKNVSHQISFQNGLNDECQLLFIELLLVITNL